MTQDEASRDSRATALPWPRRSGLLPKLSVVILGQVLCPSAYAEGEDWNLDRVQVHEAHRRGKIGAGARIGIVDTGLFANDPAFAGRIDPLSANFGAGDAGAYQAIAAADEQHGSIVAAIAAADGRNGDVRGVAPGASILHLRALLVGGKGPGIEDPTARAIRYAADAAAHVINGSYGPQIFSEKYVEDISTGQRIANEDYFEISGSYLSFNAETGRLDEDDLAAIDYAASKDVLMVFSAGNQYLDQPLAARNPMGNALLPLISRANHDSGAYLFFDENENTAEEFERESDLVFMGPSDPRLATIDYAHLKHNVIAVVATDRDNRIASYSNRCGEAWQWCIAAPGGDLDPSPADKEQHGPHGYLTVGVNGQRMVQVVGTSGAAPHVAGAAAIVRAEFPFLSAGQAQEVILTTANNAGHLSERSIYGRGLLNVERASRGPGEFGAEGFDKFFDVDTKGYSRTFSNDIRGDGGLIKRGAGTLELSGINTFSGDTTVAGGTLKVSGSTLRSNTTVRAGGTLAGSGTVGNLVSNGVVAPGGGMAPGGAVALGGVMEPGGGMAPSASAGKALHVTGDFTQLPQGVIRSTLANDGTLDQLLVAGKAELQGGTLKVGGVNSSMLGKQFVLIDAKQGVTGNFAQAQSDTATLFSSINTAVQGQNLVFSVERNKGGFGAVAKNANQRNVGKAVDSLQVGNPVFERLFNTNDANAARGSLTRLAGDIHPSVTGMLAEQQAQTRETLLSQARGGRDGRHGAGAASGTSGASGASSTDDTSGPSDADGNIRVWGEYLNSRGNLSSDGNASGLRRRNDGLIFGADTAISADTRLGGALSFGSSTANTQGLGAGQKADISSFSLSGYGSTQTGAVNLRYGASLGSSENKTRRSTDFGNAKAKYKAGTAQIFGEAGLPFFFGDATVEPYIVLAYDRARTQSFKESGAGAANLSGKKSTQGNVSSSLGVRARNSWDLGSNGKIGIHGQVAWLHAYGDITPSTRMNLEKSVAFTTQGLPRNRDAIIVGVGTTWDFSRNGSVNLGYADTFGDRAKDNSVKANFTWRF